MTKRHRVHHSNRPKLTALDLDIPQARLARAEVMERFTIPGPAVIVGRNLHPVGRK
jgi:hypothetical protein